MAKHPTSSRVHRDEDVPDDAFVSTVRRVITWAQENRRQVTIWGTVVAILAAAGVWFVSQQRSLDAAAATRFTQVQQSVASGNAQLAIRDLRSFLDTFGGTSTADQARLTLADLLIGQDQAQEAIEALGDLPDRLDAPFGLAAARMNAAALESVERYDDAVQAYRQIARNARFPYQRREALADAGRVRMQHGDAAAAVPIFEELVATFDEDAPGRGYYELWLAEARAQAQAGQGAATAAAQDTTG